MERGSTAGRRFFASAVLIGGLGAVVAWITVAFFGPEDGYYDGFLILIGGIVGIAAGTMIVDLRLLAADRAVMAGLVGYFAICAPALALTSGESLVESGDGRS